MIAVPASGSFSPAAVFFRSSGELFLPRTKFMSGKIPSSIRFSRTTFPPKRLSNLQVRAARAESSVASLGSRAPYFELPEPLTGKVWKLDDFESYPALLVMFICNHCPFVKHLKKDIVKLTNFYIKKGLAVIAISSNSTQTHPQDGPKFMAEEAKLLNYPFPYLFDESQDVARAFGAVCTPEFFLYRKDGRRPFELFYHGQFDDSRPNSNIPVTGRDLSLAIDSVLSAQQLIAVQKPSVGCSIKWHPHPTAVGWVSPTKGTAPSFMFSIEALQIFSEMQMRMRSPFLLSSLLAAMMD